MEKSGWIIYHDGEISDQIKEKEIIGEIDQKLLRLDELKSMWLSYSEKKQLVLYIDGLGWHQLKASLPQCSYFSTFNTACALSSWPPITNTALASMLSGADASVHQIKSHADRSLKLSTIFDEYPGRCVYIEGERTILYTQQSALLNPRDENDSDQAVLSCMRENLDYDFIFVHILGDRNILIIHSLSSYSMMVAAPFSAETTVTARPALSPSPRAAIPPFASALSVV